MTLLEAINKTRILLNNWSSDGVLIDGDTDTAAKDYILRMPALFDIAQKQIATVKKIVSLKKISQYLPDNQLSTAYPFDVVPYTGTEIDYEAVGSLAYNFEVDGAATVKVQEETAEDTWTTLTTVTHTTPVGEFTAYNGVIAASDTDNSIRLQFTGSSAYNIRNVALWNVAFASASVVPDYKEYIEYSMPSDFWKLNKVLLKGQAITGDSHVVKPDFYWINKTTFAIRYDVRGEYTIEYFAYPTTVDDDTADDYEFEIDEDAADGLVEYAAAQLLLDINEIKATQYMAQYQNRLFNLDTMVAPAPSRVANVLFSDSSGSNKLIGRYWR